MGDGKGGAMNKREESDRKIRELYPR